MRFPVHAATGAVAAFVVLFSPATIFAHAVANAQIHGVVTDSTDALVVGAQIRATQTATGQVRRIDDRGGCGFSS
jgi:hypothetical protein